MPILMYIVEGLFLNTKDIEWKVFKNFSHIVQIFLLLKSRNDRIFQQVTHKGGESAMNYINSFQNAQTFSVSVGNSYSED